MKVRLTKPGVVQRARPTAVRSAAGALLLAITVAACTGGGSSVPKVFTPSPPTAGHPSAGTPGSRIPSPTGGGGGSTRTGGASAPPTTHPSASGSPHTSASASPPATTPPATTPPATTPPATTPPTAVPSSAPATHPSAPVTHATAPAAPAFPSAAPETGGGGTAGLQDGLVFGIGGGAVLLGLGSLAYRRRLARKYGTKRPSPRNADDREPADR